MVGVTFSLVFGVLFFFAWFMFATIDAAFSDDVEIIYLEDKAIPSSTISCEYD
ncbi:MAG: hypothetical protein GXY06_03035 [Clostridiaceae bacterium]|nr:hypothetical protein [Clostridiaceae bacterium]